jgi:hypothetical protein
MLSSFSTVAESTGFDTLACELQESSTFPLRAYYSTDTLWLSLRMALRAAVSIANMITEPDADIIDTPAIPLDFGLLVDRGVDEWHDNPTLVSGGS